MDHALDSADFSEFSQSGCESRLLDDWTLAHYWLKWHVNWARKMALFERINPPFAERAPETEEPLSSGKRSIGEALRRQRAALGLDLSEVATVLKVKPVYLAAIEEGRPDQLPGATYALGFVRSYSDYLGLDSAEILRRFKLEAECLDAKPDLTFPMPLSERSLPSGRTLLLAIFFAICGYGVWYHLSIVERSRPERVTEVPAALLRAEPGSGRESKATASAASVSSAIGGYSPREGSHTSIKPENLSAQTNPLATAATIPGAAGEGFSGPGSVTISKTAKGPGGAPSLTPAAVGEEFSGPGSVAIGETAKAPAGPPSPTPASTQAPAAASPAAASSPIEALAATVPPQSGTAKAYGELDGPSRVTVRANADSWIQIRSADRAVLFTGLLKSGDTYRVPERPGLLMRAGNAGGLDIIVDGKRTPSLGPSGAVRNVSLDPQSLTTQSTAHD
jgi:cytoskeletal protein RodZ